MSEEGPGLIQINPFEIVEDRLQWGGDGGWHGRVISHDGASTELPNGLSDLAEIVAQYETDRCYYEGSCAAVVRLNDGRYMSWETFWGPTGNGFSEDAYGGEADVHFANDLDTIVRFGLTDEVRGWLGLDLP